MKTGLRSSKIWTGTFGIMLLTLIACGKLPGFQVDEQAQELDAEVSIDNKVDILFVVDNSLSMKPFQEKLAQAFDKFITAFSEKNMNFHVAVVSTETMGSMDYWNSASSDPIRIYNKKGDASDIKSNDSPWTAHVANGPATFLIGEKDGAQRHKVRTGVESRPHFLTPALSHDALISQFTENVKLGGESYTAEAGVLSALASLDPEKTLSWWSEWNKSNFNVGDLENINTLNEAFLKNSANIRTWNKGFLRTDSRLVIIFMSNEDESIPMFLRNDSFNRQSPYVRTLDEAATASYEKGAVALLKSIAAKGQRIHIASVVEPDSNADSRKSTGSTINVNGQDIDIVGNRYGRVYINFAKAFEGDVININKPDDFGKNLLKFSQKILNSVTQFALRQRVDKSSVAVCVDESADAVRDCYQAKFPNSKNPKEKFIMNGRMLSSAEFEIVENPADPSRPLLNVKGTGITGVPGAKYRIIYVPTAPIS